MWTGQKSSGINYRKAWCRLLRKTGAVISGRFRLADRFIPARISDAALGLPSACFDYVIKNDGIEFTCYGRGHGVGLSIYGANAMAEEGKSWKEIISWYFPGTSV